MTLVLFIDVGDLSDAKFVELMAQVFQLGGPDRLAYNVIDRPRAEVSAHLNKLIDQDINRSTEPLSHAPRITHDMTRIVGCTCGWQTPPGTTDSDTALAEHVAIIRAGEGGTP